MKEFFKNHWKGMLLVLIIVFCFIFYYEILPRYNSIVFDFGYNQCVNDMGNDKKFPVLINNGSQTQTGFIEVCSDFFIQQYPNICEIQIREEQR